MEFIKSNGRELKKEAWWHSVETGSREHASGFQVLLNPMLTYGKGGTR
jgi:hypothetical protein